MNRWLSIRVELLGGRGDTFWPSPGRVLVVGPGHTFADLAQAVNLAFARWDLSHLSMFTLPDGTVVSDEETLDELEGDAKFLGTGPTPGALDLTTTRVVDVVQPETALKYVFDFGDNWVHACTVEEYVDPREILGTVPDAPRACWGWGELPDQYGRRWADDDGFAEPPLPPASRHPMLSIAWPQPAP